jgi:hypothetical protein
LLPESSRYLLSLEVVPITWPVWSSLNVFKSWSSDGLSDLTSCCPSAVLLLHSLHSFHCLLWGSTRDAEPPTECCFSLILYDFDYRTRTIHLWCRQQLVVIDPCHCWLFSF